jgi:hypothetical protein
MQSFLVTLGFFIRALTASSSEIVPTAGSGTSVNSSGNLHEITTTKISGGNAFNQFDKFKLDANNIANMYFGAKTSNNNGNLFNFVKEKIDVNGTVNAVKNNKIGGNLYFISPDGMAVGTSGVINTGALHVIVPTKDAFDEAVSLAGNGTADPRLAPVGSEVAIPLNPSGTITVRGKVNATEEISLHAAKITLGDKSDAFSKDPVSGRNNNQTAVLKTGVTDFSNLVNIGSLQSTLTPDQLTVAKTGSGNITLSARASRAATPVSDPVDGNYGDVDTIAKNQISAGIDSYGNIEADGTEGKVQLTAKTTNGDLRTEPNPDGKDLYDSEYMLADMDASVNILDGVISGNDVDVSAEAVNVWDMPTLYKAGVISVSNLLGGLTPVNIGAALTILSAEANVTVAKDATLEAAKDLSVKAVGEGRATVGAKTAYYKLNDFVLKGAGSKIPDLAVAYVEIASDAKVDIQGRLKAGGTLDVKAESTVDMSAMAKAVTRENSAEFDVAAMISRNKNNAAVSIGKDAVLTSGKAMSVESSVFNALEAEAEGGLSDVGKLIATVNYAEFQSAAAIEVAGKLTTSGANGDIRIAATNTTTDNDFEATTTNGYSKFLQDIIFERSEGIIGLLDIFKEKVLGIDTDGPKSSGFLDLFKVGLTANIVLEKNNANVTIKNPADISAAGKLDIVAETVLEDLHVGTENSVFGTSMKNNAKYAFGAAVTWADVENTAGIAVEDGASLKAAGELSLESAVREEYKRPDKLIERLLESIDLLSGSYLDDLNAVDLEGQDEITEAEIADLRAWNAALKQTGLGADDIFGGETITITNAESGETKSGTFLELTKFLTEKAQSVADKLDARVDAVLGTTDYSWDRKAAYGLQGLRQTIDRAAEFTNIGNYGNLYTRSAASGGENDLTGVAGAVTWATINNRSEVSIGKNVVINTAKDLAIRAENITETVTLGGNVSPLILPNGGSKGTSAGGSLNVLHVDNSAAVTIREKTELSGEHVNIEANNDVMHVAAALSAGRGSTAISGMVNYLEGASRAEISVDDEVVIHAGEIALTAANDTSVANVAGALSAGTGNGGVGIAVAVNDLDAMSKAAVEDNDGRAEGVADDKNPALVTIDTGKITVTADAHGTINAVSVAGAVAKNGNDGNPGFFEKLNKISADVKGVIGNAVNFLPAKLQHWIEFQYSAAGAGAQGGNNNAGGNPNVNGNVNGNAVQGFSMAVAGSSAVNLGNNETLALMDGANIQLRTGNEGVVVEARDDAFIGAWSGAAALQWQHIDQGSTRSVAVEGALAINKLGNSTQSIVRNSVITDAAKIEVHALSGGVQVAAGLGLAVAKESGGQGGNYQLGTSVSLNLIDHDVAALLENNTVSGTTGNTALDVAAYESDVQVTGGLNMQFGKSKGSLGAAVAVADLTNSVRAEITGGSYAGIGSASVNALLATTQITAALSAGITADGTGTGSFEGSGAANDIKNTVRAAVSGAQITAAGDLNVSAKDTRPDSLDAAPLQARLSGDAVDYASGIGVDTTGASHYDNLDLEDNTMLGTPQGAVIVSAAASLAATGNAAVGAAVSVDLIENDFTAVVEKGSVIEAAKVDVNALSDVFMINGALGVAVSKDKFAGMGSAAWQELSNTASAVVDTATITTGALGVLAENHSRGVNLGGQVSYGNKAGVGFVLAYEQINNNTEARLQGTVLDARMTNGQIDVTVAARNTANLNTIGVGVAVSATVAVGGVVAMTQGNEDTRAFIDENIDHKRNTIANAGNIAVASIDQTALRTIAGSVNVSSGNAAVGGAVAYSDIGGSSGDATHGVYAGLNRTDIVTASGGAKTVNVGALDESYLLTVAGGAGIAGGSVAVQGAAATAFTQKTVEAALDETNLNGAEAAAANKNADVTVTAQSAVTHTTTAAVAAASADVAVGAGVSINKITQNTSAHVSGGTHNVKNELVKGLSSATITNIGIGGAGSGEVAVAGSISVNLIENNTTSALGDGIKLHASGNAGIIAESDENIENYVGALFGSGTAAVGVSTSVNEISGSTTAMVSGDATEITVEAAGSDAITTEGTVDGVVDGLFKEFTTDLGKKRVQSEKTGLVIDSSATHNIKSLLVTGGGSGAVTVSGTVNVNRITGETEATVDGAKLTGGNVSVHAGDYTNALGIVGAVAVGGNVGIGAASDTAIVSRAARTKLSDAAVEGAALSVDAEAKQGISSFTAGVAGTGTGAGVAGTVSVAELSGETVVELVNTDLVGASADIGTSHEGILSIGNAAAAFAAEGGALGAAVAVTKDETKTAVRITDGSLVRTTGNQNVTATNHTKANEMIVSAGVGVIGAGVDLALSVNNLAAEVEILAENSNLSSDNGDIAIHGANAFETGMKSIGVAGGFAGAGAVVTVNTLQSGVLTTLRNTSVTADKGAILVKSEETRETDQLIGSVAMGVGALTANVILNSFGTALGDPVDENGNKLAVLAQMDGLNAEQDAKFDDGTASLLDARYKALSDGSEGFTGEGYGVKADHGGEAGGIRVIVEQGSVLQGNTIDLVTAETDNLEMKGGSGVVGLGAALGTVGTLSIDRNTVIEVSDSNLAATGNLTIDNQIGGTSTLELYQGALGAAALGAAYGEISVNGSAGIAVDHAKLTANAGDVILRATDQSALEAGAYGLSAGVVAAGAIVAKATNSGNVALDVKDSEFSGNNVNLESQKKNTVTAKANSGSVGLATGIGTTATAIDQGASDLQVSGANKFTGTSVGLRAANGMQVLAQSLSASLTLFTSVGVSQTRAEASGGATLNVGAGSAFTADAVTFSASVGTTADGETTAKARTESVGGSALVSVSPAMARAKTDAKAVVNVGAQTWKGKTGDTVGDLNIAGSNKTTAEADIWSLTIGGVAAANYNLAKAESYGTTTVTAAGGTADRIRVSASTVAANTLSTDGNGGGILAAGAAFAENTTQTETTVNLGGAWTAQETFQAAATDTNTASLNGDAVKGGFVGYNGVHLTNIFGDAAKKTAVNIADGATITGGGDLDIEATNLIDAELSAKGAAYGGLGVSDVSASNTINKSAEIHIGKATVTTDGSQIWQAATTASVNGSLNLDADGAVSATTGRFDNDLETANTVSLDAGGVLRTAKSDGDITLAAWDSVTGKIEAVADTAGVGGAAVTDVKNAVTRRNTVTSAGTIHSGHDVNLYASRDKNGQRAKMDWKNVSHAYFYGVVAAAVPSLESSVHVSDQVITAAGSKTESVRNITIAADNGSNRVEDAVQKFTWYNQAETSDYVATESGQKNRKITSDNMADLAGTLTAGIQNKQMITIEGIVDLSDGSDGHIVGGVSAPTVTYADTVNKPEVSWGTQEYGNYLMDRYNEVTNLLSSYSGDKTNPAYSGYLAEQERLLDEMKDLGLVCEDEHGIRPIANLEIQYIQIGDVVASGGNITIDADTLTGFENLTAQGNPEISIINDANLYLRVRNVKILENGGKITVNGEVKSDAGTEGNSNILIQNNWTGTVMVHKDGETDKDVRPLTTIEINGSVENLLGDVTIENKGGDIVIQGESVADDTSVVAGGNLTVDASGSVTQGFTNAIVHIDGTPQSDWKTKADQWKSDAYDAMEAARLDKDSSGSYTTTEQPTPSTGTPGSGWVAGGNIYINASAINVSGLIQSGYAVYDVTIADSADLQNKIAAYDKKWNENKEPVTEGTLKNYVLIEGGARYDSASGTFTYQPTVYYDPSTKQAVVEDIAAGGGKVQLTGRIISTGNGKITAVDGAAEISITNETALDLRVGEIHNKNSAGKIIIHDELTKTTTEYTRDGATVADAAGNKTTSADGSTFTPQVGVRYNWTRGSEATSKATHQTTNKGIFWDWDIIENNIETILTYDVVDEVDMGNRDKPEGGYLTTGNTDETLRLDYSNKVLNQEVTATRTWRKYHDWFHFSYTDYAEYDVVSGTEQVYTFSAKADNPIAIAFIGAKDGNIVVNSATNIQLAGALTNAAAAGGTATTTITAQNGAVTQTAGTIGADTILLSGKNGIEGVQIKGLGSDVELRAEAANGSVDITSQSAVVIDDISARDAASLKAYGDITQKTAGIASVTASRIDLGSDFGGIDLVVQTGQTPSKPQDSMSASLNAKASGDVRLIQQSGDMRIGKIESAGGDVTLTTTGALIDALPAGLDVENATRDELIARWKKAGLIDSPELQAQKQAVYDAYCDSVRADFDRYLSLKAQADALEGASLTIYQQLQGKYGAYADASAYLADDSVAENARQEKLLQAGGKWGENELLYAIEDAIVNPSSGSTQKVIKDPNITGKNITIQAGTGIGRDEAPEVIDLTKLSENDYAAMKKLAGSEAADVYWDEAAGTATITAKNPVGIRMTDPAGKLKAESAGGNIYLAARTDDNADPAANTLYVDDVHTDGNIRVQGTGGIERAAGTSGDIFTGKDLILEGGAGSLGKTGDPVKINIDGTLSARADGEVNILQSGAKDLDIAAVYSGGDVRLATGGNLYRKEIADGASAESYINAGGTIWLTAAGEIGTADEAIRILNKSGAVHAAGNGDITLAGVGDGELILADVTSTDGDIAVDSEDGLTTAGKVAAKAVSLSAEGKLTLKEGEIKADEVALASRAGNITQVKAAVNAPTLTASANTGIDLGLASNHFARVTLANNSGDIKLINNNAGGLTLDFAKVENKGNITIDNRRGALEILSDAAAAGEGTLTILNTADIDAKNLRAGNNARIETKIGDIRFDSLTAGNDAEVATGTGNIALSELRAGQKAAVTTDLGDIRLDNLTAGGDVLVETVKKGGVTSGGSLVSTGGSLEIRAAQGDIVLNKVYAKKTALANARDGNLVIAEINGETVALFVQNENKVMDVAEIIAGIHVITGSNDIRIDELTRRPGYDDALVWSPRNPDSAKPIKNLDVNLKLNNGLIIDELWAQDANIRFDGKYLDIEKMRITGKGLITSGGTTVGVYGANGGPDGSDIDLWNDADSPDAWIRLLFPGKKHTVYSDGVLLQEKEGYRTLKDRFSAVEIMGMELGSFIEKRRKEEEVRRPAREILRPWLRKDLIQNNLHWDSPPDRYHLKDPATGPLVFNEAPPR